MKMTHKQKCVKGVGCKKPRREAMNEVIWHAFIMCGCFRELTCPSISHFLLAGLDTAFTFFNPQENIKSKAMNGLRVVNCKG